MTSTLVQELATRTGLARIIATGVIRRACARINVDPDLISRDQLPLVIDAMEPLLAVYLGADASARVAELRRYAKTL